MFDEQIYGRDMSIDREAKTESELGVVFKQRVGPRRTSAVAVCRVRCGREIAAVDRRASGGVGDEQAIAKQLCEQFEIRSLTATGARARVLKQRLEKLRAFMVETYDVGAIELGQIEKEVVIGTFGVAQRRLRFHVDRLVLWIGPVFGRAHVNAEITAGAVFRRHLNRERLPLVFSASVSC